MERYQVKKTIHKITINDALEDIMFEHKDNNDSVFLIDEDYFNLIRCPIEGMMYDSLTLVQFNNLITLKVEEVKKQYNLHGYMLMYDVENITIDWTPSQYILGQSGYMKWDIFFIFIKPSLAIACPTLLENTAGPLVYPSSYFTVQFMVKNLQIESFIIITFDENCIKLITIKDGFYNTIENLDRWINNLKQILISNNIIQYFNKTDQEIESNTMAKSIFIESISFYNKVAIDWIKQHNENIKTCIISIPSTKNNIFTQQFIQQYSEEIWWYIVQSTTIDSTLNDYNKKRQMNELDILTYLNFAETKELI